MFSNTAEMDNLGIKITRTKKFEEISIEVSNFIRDLNLSKENNNNLINLIVKQVNEAEHSSFLSGVELGLKIGRDKDLSNKFSVID